MPLGILLSQRETQQARGGVHRVVVLLDLGLHAAFGFVLCRLAVAGNDHDQIVGLGARSLGEFLAAASGKSFSSRLKSSNNFAACPSQ